MASKLMLSLYSHGLTIVYLDGPPLLSTSVKLSKPTENSKRPERPLHFTCLTIGSRGDVQPYVALCKELQKDGHTCRIATHPEYEQWITQHGIEFKSIGGDPGELMVRVKSQPEDAITLRLILVRRSSALTIAFYRFHSSGRAQNS